MVRPSFRSTHRVTSSKLTVLAEMLMPCRHDLIMPPRYGPNQIGLPPTLKTTGTTDHSAASFSASAAACNAAALASTSATMCSTIEAPSIVWSVLPAA